MGAGIGNSHKSLILGLVQHDDNEFAIVDCDIVTSTPPGLKQSHNKRCNVIAYGDLTSRVAPATKRLLPCNAG